jgi:hypothetical protein
MYNYQLMKKALIPILFLYVLDPGKRAKLQAISASLFTALPDTSNGRKLIIMGTLKFLVVGESPLVDELKTLAQNKKVGDRPIKIVKISGVAEIRKCSMIFLPAERSNELPEVLKRVKDQSILVMTEQAGLGMQGSCINFITKEGKLAFELNQSALIKQNLKASTELTRLAYYYLIYGKRKKEV